MNNTTQGIDLDKLTRRHELKTDPAVFAAVLEGAKTHEIRKNDRDFTVGDTLLLRETVHSGEHMQLGAPLEYTGRELVRAVSHVLTGYGLQDDWCILSLARQQTPVTGKVIPMNAISKTLADAMAIARESGANSISMPDEYVAVAHFVAYPEQYGTQQAAPEAPTLPDDATEEMRLAFVKAYNFEASPERWRAAYHGVKAPATHQATLAAPAEQIAQYERVHQVMVDTAGDLADALLKARDWLGHNPEAVSYINKSIALAGIRPASPPKPAASQQAVANSEQQEKVAPPPRGTGSQHDVQSGGAGE